MATTLMAATDWAAQEFGGAQLGDGRRSRRLLQLAAALAEDPHGTLPGSFESWAEVKAAYRLLEGPDVTYDRILTPHRTRVRAACRQPGEYLLVEDTSELDFSSHLAAQDLGRIGNDGGRGLFVHSTLALRIQRWNARQEPEVTFEGLFDQRWWARTTPTGRKRRRKREKLSEPRESARWAASAAEAGSPPAEVRWTFVADRESDLYETFGRCEDQHWNFILRACQPRALADADGSVFTAVGESREWGRFTVDLRARPGQAARPAEVAVRVCTVNLRGPWRPGGELPPRCVRVVEARELDPPAGVEPLHWVLLTDWPCATFEQAWRVIQAYTRRWLIEEYHKCLKTGTGVEQSQLATAARLTALLAILAVVAVRLLNVKLLAATLPDEPVGPEELGPEALEILETKFGRPRGGWTHQSLLVGVARLGGFLARKGDGNPGWLTLWRGWRKLMLLVQGYDLARAKRCG
jgi:hypothetical protein